MVKNLPFWGKLATLSLGNALKTTFANRPFLIYLARPRCYCRRSFRSGRKAVWTA
ncbi:MAG: hypothetical protein GX354_08865 [Firmicutes bacterium]|nr:hypothetical protein [Bacillota bacterium]